MKYRFLFASIGVALVVFILGASLWRLNLPVNSREDIPSASLSVQSHLRDLFSGPVLPDNPWYLVLRLKDRLQLLVASPQIRFYLQVQFADERLQTAQLLLTRHRSNSALTVTTKAEKYILAAGPNLRFFSGAARQQAEDILDVTIARHIGVLGAMKRNISDAQRAVIDNLIEQLRVIPISRR